MGLFDFIKDEFIEIIDWVDNEGDVILWKFPDRDANIKNGAQLTVRESQLAIFMDEGQIADIFSPGMYELYTSNLPVLTTLRNWKSGFKSPFKCDVYFISTKTFTDLKWGTTNPVMMRDPEFKQVRVRAHGTYFIRIKEVETFLKVYAGTSPKIRISDLENSLRDIVSPKFAEALSESGVSVLDIASNYSELGAKIMPILQKDLDPLGVELVNFQISSSSLPKEVEEFYDKMTNMNMVDNMDQFTKFSTANAMEKASENPGGSGEGIGMGMGFGMAKMMSEQMGQSDKTPQSKEDIMQLIKDLGQLMKEGLLSEEEFENKKKELLKRL